MSLSPSDQLHAGSLPSWPPMDFNASLSCLLPEELQHRPTFPALKSASSSPSLNPPPLLSSPASIGASTAKVSKRKSRAVTKPPIRVLSADRATFRDMVQKLTGIPTSPSMQANRLWGAGNLPALFRPMGQRPSAQNDVAATAHQNMPTLDTSSAYLARGFSSNNLVYNEGGKSRFGSHYEGNFDSSARHSVNFDASAGGSMGDSDLSGVGMYEGGVYNGVGTAMDMESLRQLHRTSELESLLMGSSKLEDLLQSNKMDRWLSPDFMLNPSSQVEIAHSA